MIRHTELFRVLTRKIPALPIKDNDVEEGMLHFSYFTRQAARNSNVHCLKTCLVLAQQLYTNGDDQLKRAIEHIYMPPLNNLLKQDCPAGRWIRIHLPICLYHLYIQQVYKH